MKILGIILLATFGIASALFADPQYTLQSICEKYGKFGQCSSVPFCKEQSFQQGCYLRQGAPAYIEALCKMQTMKQGCAVMESQGNCVWVEDSVSTCDAKVQSL